MADERPALGIAQPKARLVRAPALVAELLREQGLMVCDEAADIIDALLDEIDELQAQRAADPSASASAK